MRSPGLDFTSALYLGLRHPMGALRPWNRLTTGVPYALSVPREVRRLEIALAELQGFQRSTLGPSTLHLFWDLFALLGREGTTIYLDAAAYPIARWGVERAMVLGTLVRPFAHLDADRVARQVRRDAPSGRRPVIVSDGFCPACGSAAPLPRYLQIVREFGGYLVIDDTQALGILGRDSERRPPYGSGGGGTVGWFGIDNPRVIAVSSLAKGFGVPVAVLSGSRTLVERFEAASETRVHTSPPSIAAIRAAEHALDVNRTHGDRIRERLARRVAQFRRCTRSAGVVLRGGFFPVQGIQVPTLAAAQIDGQLRQRGVVAVLQRTCDGGPVCITFLITARHSGRMIARAADVVATVVAADRIVRTRSRCRR